MLVRDAGIWRLLCTGGENLAAASKSSVSRDGHLALQTISRDEIIKARILQQTNSPGNVLSSKQLSSIRSFQWTHTQSEHSSAPNPPKPSDETQSQEIKSTENARCATKRGNLLHQTQTKIFSHPYHKPYSPSNQNLQTKTNPRTSRSTENTRSATKRVNLLLKTSDEDPRSPYHNPIPRPSKNIR